jgi:hypothetical protein
MEVCAGDIDGGEVVIGNDDAFWIEVFIEFAMDGKTGTRSGSCDQIDNDAMADQRFGAPVVAYEGEQSVLDLVPLAGAWWKVTDRDVDSDLVGQVLQLALPQPRARAIAAAAIGGDEQLFGFGVANAADLLPPATDRLHREGRSVVIHPDADPAMVSRQVIDPVWHRSPQLLDQKVVHPHLLWLSFRLPLAPTILEVADQLLLLGVDGDDRLLPGQCGADQLIDVAKLRIPIRMAVALSRLAIGLQTEAATRR